MHGPEKIVDTPTTAVECTVTTQAYEDMIQCLDWKNSILILAPLNNNVSHLNQICTGIFRGDIWVLVSVDAVMDKEDGSESNKAVPLEVMYAVSFPGFSAHILKFYVRYEHEARAV
ncbi:hypothetical protein MJO29_016754 [Puccinia striiformis f. sp. tritici]|nr:hypothetical protein MJO29_016754 [Puccinia striiformis f. sp. tritici]